MANLVVDREFGSMIEAIAQMEAAWRALCILVGVCLAIAAIWSAEL